MGFLKLVGSSIIPASVSPQRNQSGSKKISSFVTISGIDTKTKESSYSKKNKETLNSFDKILDAIAKKSPKFSTFVDDSFLTTCQEVGGGECKLGMDLLLIIYSKGILQKFYNGMSETENRRTAIAVECREILVNEVGIMKNFAIDLLYILQIKMNF